MASIAIAFLCVAPAARATTYPQTTFDNIILSADAIVFATVMSFNSVDDQTLVITLGEIVPVTWRWDATTDELLVPVAAHFAGLDAVVPFPYQPALQLGRRYLLFLKGGRWLGAPMITSGEAIHEVLDDGTVGCPGGAVFGLGVKDFICRRPLDTFGTALSEGDLSIALYEYERSARARRPMLAARYDAATAEFDDSPSSSSAEEPQ